MVNLPIDPSEAGGAPKIGGDPTKPGKISQPDASSFEAYKEGAPGANAPEASQISPMDLASKTGISTTPTFSTLLAQANTTQDTLGDVQKNLNTPNLKLKKSQTDLLNTKLNNANDYLTAANQKLGAKVPEQTQIPKSANPITKFVGLVTDGQNKLVEVQNQIKNLNAKPGYLQPGDMLLIQVKLAQAQQEIEYSSVLLSKTIDSLKQILNIQI
ncbi:MAG: hypothetical protein K940chlam1_00981 [Candidatus Anoxychlamydiales bacterium]|nr:hypothetical protein [Candidatus Anoxychlamydiales bacterium]NGX36321.1 hypothetical protein [Candidatus Anoxychlamydiales bacterium]